jgi:hypothetical protein
MFFVYFPAYGVVDFLSYYEVSGGITTRGMSFEVALFELLAMEILDKPWFSYSYSGAAGTRARPARFEYEYHFIEYEYD